MLLLILILVVASFLLAGYVRKMAPFYVLSSKVPGPYAFPVIGSAWKFINTNPEEIMQVFIDVTKKYPSTSRFWLGPKFVLIIGDPEDARIVLSSNRMNRKADVYRFLEPFFGKGLITGGGTKYKDHKKLIQPFVNNEFVISTLNLFMSFSDDFLNTLGSMVGKGVFNVEHIIQMYVADILAIKILGYDTETRKGRNLEFLEVAKRFYELANHRMVKPWLHPDETFKFSKLHTVQKEVLQNMDTVILTAIRNAKNRLKDSGIFEDSPVIDKLLNAIKGNPAIMTEEELGHHLKTLFAASEDTMVNVSSFVLVCLGMPKHAKHQDKILKELEGIESSPHEYLTGSPHLTNCIKEVLRLFPAGPLLLRETMDHFQLGDLILPPECTVLINVWGIHHDPKHWEHPEDFYPEHFNSEAVSKRPPCSYIPFSMGPRACVGKALSYPWLKLIIATVLREFIVETEENLKSFKLHADVAVRAANGYNISLKRRN